MLLLVKIILMKFRIIDILTTTAEVIAQSTSCRPEQTGELTLKSVKDLRLRLFGMSPAITLLPWSASVFVEGGSAAKLTNSVR
jgi:hypothetical protein